MTNAITPDAPRLSGLHVHCNLLDLKGLPGRIRRSRLIRDEQSLRCHNMKMAPLQRHFGPKVQKRLHPFFTLFFASAFSISRYQRGWCFFAQRRPHLPFDHPFNRPFHPKCHIHMDQMAWIEDIPAAASGISRPSSEQPVSGKYCGKVRTPIITPVTSSTKIMLMIDQNIIFCPALYLPTSATLCSHRLSILPTMFNSHGISFLYPGCCDAQNAQTLKHQCDENRNAGKNVCKMRPIRRRTEGLRQPLQRRAANEIPDSATRKKQITTVQ